MGDFSGLTMRFEGTLTTWNAERGYGEITPLLGGQAVFVHVSALPMDGELMRLGELLSFELVAGRDGRKAAARVQRLQRVSASAAERVLMAAAPHRPVPPRQRRRRWARALIGVALLAGVGGGLYWMHADALKSPAPPKHLERRACLDVGPAKSLQHRAQVDRFGATALRRL